MEAYSPRNFGELTETNIVPRETWGAQPPSGPVPVLNYKPNKVAFTFNTRSESCDTKEECIKVVQKIQNMDMSEGEPDISYNFLVGNDGYVYEGRGWNGRATFVRKIPTPEYPEQTLEFAFIGDYSETRWPFGMMETAVRLINYGVKHKHVQASYELL